MQEEATEMAYQVMQGEGEVTVLHAGTSVLTMTPCAQGVSIWADGDEYTLRTLPRIFNGCTLVQLPCRLDKRVDIVVRSPATIYVFFPASKPDEPRMRGETEYADEDMARAAAANAAAAADAEGQCSDGGLASLLKTKGWILHDIDEILATALAQEDKVCVCLCACVCVCVCMCMCVLCAHTCERARACMNTYASFHRHTCTQESIHTHTKVYYDKKKTSYWRPRTHFMLNTKGFRTVLSKTFLQKSPIKVTTTIFCKRDL